MPTGSCVQASEHDRLIGELQPLDVRETIGTVASRHAVDDVRWRRRWHRS